MEMEIVSLNFKVTGLAIELGLDQDLGLGTYR
jgi:hypothetical protein